MQSFQCRYGESFLASFKKIRIAASASGKLGEVRALLKGFVPFI